MKNKPDVSQENKWRSLRFCARTYPKRVVKIVMCQNADQATFQLWEKGDEFVLNYKPMSQNYGEKAILEELNYYLFVEEQRKIAEPIRREIVRGLVKRLTK